MDTDLKALSVSPKTGDEKFIVRHKLINESLSDFWKWFASDLNSNALRGVLAEFIVAMALQEINNTRIEWNTYDLNTKSGLKIEVKSAAYIQTWQQDNFSKISFTINKTRGWDADTNVITRELKRHADVYVFCVLKTKDQREINPMDLDQWCFYVLPTSILDAKVSDQKTITLNSLIKLNPIKTDYIHLSEAIDNSIEMLL